MSDILLILLSATLQALTESICVYLTLKSGRIGRAGSALFFFLSVNLLNWGSTLLPFAGWKPVVMYSVQFIILHLLYRDPLKEKLFLFCVIYSVGIPLEALAFASFEPGFVPLSPVADQNIPEKASAGVLLAAVQIPWTLMFRKVRKEWEDSVMWKFYLFVLGQFAVEMVALQAVYLVHMTEKNGGGLLISSENVWLYRGGIVLFILSTGLIYYILFAYMKKEHMNRKIREEEREIEKNIEYYREVEERAARMRRIRHDSENHLRMAGRLIGADPKKAEEYLEELKRIINEI